MKIGGNIMKKRILIMIPILVILSSCLSGCDEFGILPEIGSEEEKEIQEWVEKIENRVKVTVNPTADVYDATIDEYVSNKTVCIDILCTSGARGRWCKDTRENGFISFESVTYNLDAGQEISATASIYATYYIDKTFWLPYNIAKSNANYDNETGYTYSWNVHFPLWIQIQ